jgi:hypothetical protein
LGLLGAIGLSGQLAAAPPGGQPVEAREVPQPHVAIGGCAPESTLTIEGAWLVLSVAMWDVLLDRMTVPLGTASVPESDGGSGA